MKYKKSLLVLLVVLISTVLISCKNRIETGGESPLKLKEASPTIAEYFPFTENRIFSYEGIGNEFAGQEVYFEYIEGNKAQFKIINSGTEVIKILEYDGESLKEKHIEGEAYYVTNRLDDLKKSEDENIILKEPLTVGSKWEAKPGIESRIKSLDKTLDLPYGKLEDVLEVETSLGGGRMQRDYYVKNLGHVAAVYKDGDFEAKTLLSSVVDQEFSSQVRFYYPIKGEKYMASEDRIINYTTNSDFKEHIIEGLKDPADLRLNSALSGDVILKKMDIDRKNDAIVLDFNKELVSSLEVFGDLEGVYLKSIANTFADYYKVSKVFIRVNGRSYKSKNIDLVEGTYLLFDSNGIKDINN